MTDPTKEAYEGLLEDVYVAADFRASHEPNEAVATNAGIAFTVGMTLALRHPEYVRALEPHFGGKQHLKVMVEAMVQGNPIERVEVESLGEKNGG